MAQGRTAARRALASSATYALVGALVLLFAFAQVPWLRAGFSTSDYAVWLGEPRSYLLTVWSQLFPLPEPGHAALAARLESLVSVVLFALGLAHFLRRALAPWVGKERARTTGALALVFLLLHPLLSASMTSEAAHAGRLSLALAGAGAGFFLAGRQEGREGRTAASLILFFLSGVLSLEGAPLVLFLALAEYTSAHRHRPRSLRLRTAATTAFLFAAAVLLPRLVAGQDADGVFARSLAPRTLLRACVEELGRLCVPAQEAAGVAGMLASGAVLLLVFQPLFRAARSAPRLWGALFAAWSALFGLGLAWWSFAARDSGSSTARELLLLGVLGAGFALGTAALSVERARWITLAVAVIFAPLAHVAARQSLLAGELTGRLHDTLLAKVPPGREPVFVLDPLGGELDSALTRQLGWLLHPALRGEAAGPESFDPRRVRALPAAAFLLLARQPSATRPWTSRALVLRPEGELAVFRPTVTGERASALRPWRTELGCTFERGLDPRSLAAVEVVAELATQPDELASLAWKTRDGQDGEVHGIVRELRGRRLARYDLSASLDWCLAEEVRSFALAKGKRTIERAEFLERLPVPAGSPQPLLAGDDWLFHVEPPAEARECVLQILALAQLDYREFPVSSEAPGILRARQVESLLRADGPAGECLWALEFRSEGQVLARLEGALPEVP